MAVGAGLSGAGSYLGKKDASKNAADVAAARNRVLRENLGKIDQFAAQGRGLFDTRMADYSPTAQGGALTNAQTARSGEMTSGMTAPPVGDIPLSADAPNAVKSEIAKRMLSAFQTATERAKASGKLGGYNDAWTTNALGVNDTGRRVGTINNFARGEASLIEPLQDAAAVQAYKPPALLPQVMTFAGNILAGAGGRGMGGGGAPITTIFGDPLSGLRTLGR